KRKLAVVVLIVWGIITLVYPFKTSSIALNPLVFEFSLGVALGAFRKNLMNIPLSTMFLLMIVFTYLGYSFAESKDYFSRAVTFGISSFTTLSIAISLENRGVKVHNAWKVMGDASYAMYLSHYVLL